MKNVFITGGTSGIGLELAKVYQEQGNRVAICGRDLEKVPKGFREKISAYKVDVRNSDELKAAVSDFSNGKLDLIIACAGRSVGGKSRLPDFNMSKEVIEINLFGVLNTFEAAMDIMLKNKSGHIAVISSVAGMVGLPGAASYSASKSAVSKLCESFSIDLKREGISVSNILPGFIDTPLTRKNDHSMPFLMSVEEGGSRIYNAIEKKKSIYIFPLPMKIVMVIFEKMPRWMYRSLMNLPIFNYSKG